MRGGEVPDLSCRHIAASLTATPFIFTAGRTIVFPVGSPSALISNLYDVSTDDHNLVVYKMGGDLEVWPLLATTSHVASRRQRGRLNLNWLTPPFVPLRSVQRICDALSYFVKINIPISGFDDQFLFQKGSVLAFNGNEKIAFGSARIAKEL